MKTKILLLSLLALTMFQCKKDVKNGIDSTTTKEVAVYKITEGKHCFIETIENEIKDEKKSTIEINKLVVNLTVEGNKVHGSFDYIPYNDKTNNGNFTGNLDGNIAKTVCVFNQDGSVKKEEVIFKIDANKISILGGEKEEIDGVWKFKDASNGFYMNEIPRINCN